MLVYAVDLGTTNVKVVLYDEHLREEVFSLLAVSDLMGRQRYYDQFRPAVLNGQ